MTKRKHGYYWVKRFDTWFIAEYSEGFKIWFAPGDEKSYKDVDFDEIDEKRIEMQEDD